MASWTHFPCLSDQKTRPFSGPKNGPTLRLLSDFLTGRPKGEAGKWAHFWVVWSPKMRPCQVPSVAHLAHGSSPIFGCHRGLDQRFSGRSACYHSQPPDLICQIPSVSFLLPPFCSFFCLPRSVDLIAKRPRILMP